MGKYIFFIVYRPVQRMLWRWATTPAVKNVHRIKMGVTALAWPAGRKEITRTTADGERVFLSLHATQLSKKTPSFEPPAVSLSHPGAGGAGFIIFCPGEEGGGGAERKARSSPTEFGHREGGGGRRPGKELASSGWWPGLMVESIESWCGAAMSAFTAPNYLARLIHFDPWGRPLLCSCLCCSVRRPPLPSAFSCSSARLPGTRRFSPVPFPKALSGEFASSLPVSAGGCGVPWLDSWRDVRTMNPP